MNLLQLHMLTMTAIFVLMGALALLAAVIAIPKLRNLDSELADAI